MRLETYRTLLDKMDAHPTVAQWIGRANLLITAAAYIAYPALVLFLLFTRDPRVLRVLLTAAVSFVLVTLLRYFVHAPRPYEVLSRTGAIHKSKKGSSFPSRHVFSIFVIAMTFIYICLPLGIVFLLLGAVLAVLRVVGGVHFIKDVVAGSLIGIVSGVLGLYIF